MAVPTLDKAPYTLQNLPYGVISTTAEPQPRCAVAIGDHALDLARYAFAGKLAGVSKEHGKVGVDHVFGQVRSCTSTGPLNTFG